MKPGSWLDGFLTGRIAPEQFGHREHVIVAYLLLCRHPFEESVTIFSDGARALAECADAPRKFHVTLTRMLMILIDSDRRFGNYRSCQEYLDSNPEVLCNGMGAVSRHYSPERLWSEEARKAWIEPDRRPLPGALVAERSEVA